MKSPLPTPKFFKEKSFSSKKERIPRSIVKPPPTPRLRYNALHRLVSDRNSLEGRSGDPDRARSISSKSSLSSTYDSNSELLYYHQCFEEICKLGSGSFANVYKVRCYEDGKFYAIKKAKQHYGCMADRKRKLQEAHKHEQLPSHPNCVRFFMAWEEKSILYLQIELCKCSLSQYAEENHDITENIVWCIVSDMLQAVKHLHDNNLIHLDIKSENIFISENGIFKLGDFGLVQDLSKGTSEASEGDPKYIAPEVMKGIYSKAADIFSLGITILEAAIDLDLPDRDEDWHKLRESEIPAKCLTELEKMSPQLSDIITIMLESDYLKRLSADEILGLGLINMAVVVEGRQEMIDSLERMESERLLSDKSDLSEHNSSISDDVFENLPVPMDTSNEQICVEKSFSVDDQVTLNNNVGNPRPRCGVSTPSSFRFWAEYRNSCSPCLSGSKRKQLSPKGDSSPVFPGCPRSQLFNSNSDEDTAPNHPAKSLLSVFDALSPN